MKKLTIATFALLLTVGLQTRAQEAPKKKKPPFSLDVRTMTELGITPEQQQKIEASKQAYREATRKLQEDAAELNRQADRREDSVISKEQKLKLTELREQINRHNKENPTQRKNLVFDLQTATDLGLSADQQQKLTVIQKESHLLKWQHSQKWSKITQAALKEQDAVLTEEQRKKIAEMKEAIAVYNKTIQ